MSTQALLSYGINIKPQTPIAGCSVEIDLVITNDSSAGVVLQGIKIELPVGDTSTDISNDASGITSSCPASWKAYPSQAGAGTISFIFQPVTAKITVNPNDSFTLSLSNVGLNTAAGTATLIITEGSANNPTESFEITKYPGSWGSINFTALPANINAGNSVTLSWKGPVDASYSIQYIDHSTNSIVNIPASGQPVLSNEGQYPGAKNPPLTPSGSTLFTLQVQQVVDNVPYKQEFQQTVSVIPAPPKITSFNYALLSNNSVQFNWTTTGASRVEGSWSSEELKANNPMPSTSATVPYVVGTIYTITAYSSDNQSCSARTMNWQLGSTVFTENTPGVVCKSIASTPDGQFIFVGVSGQLLVIDVSTQTVVNTLTLVSDPILISITPDGRYALIQRSDGILSIIDVNTLTDVHEISLDYQLGQPLYPSTHTYIIAITPDSHYALCSNSSDYVGTTNVSVIDLTNLKIVKSIPIGIVSRCIAITPNGKQAFALDKYKNDMVVIDLTTLSVAQTIQLPKIAFALAITPDSHYVLVCVGESVMVFDTTNLSLAPKAIITGSPNNIVITANGHYATVTNGYGGTISVIDLTNLSATPQTINLSFDSYLLANTPNSRYVFVANNSFQNTKSVSVIDLNNISFPAQNISIGNNLMAFTTPDINTVFILGYKGVQTLVARY